MNWDILSFLAAPFVASLVIAGIHAYLGVHVVERGVIFVDLSLAQIAAFGATVAILLPWSDGDPHSPSVYWVALVFTFIGAAMFATIRSRRARIPQEAIIGISYAVASAATILALSKSTSEGEHLKDMLVGNLLSVGTAVRLIANDRHQLSNGPKIIVTTGQLPAVYEITKNSFLNNDRHLLSNE